MEFVAVAVAVGATAYDFDTVADWGGGSDGWTTFEFKVPIPNLYFNTFEVFNGKLLVVALPFTLATWPNFPCCIFLVINQSRILFCILEVSQRVSSCCAGYLQHLSESQPSYLRHCWNFSTRHLVDVILFDNMKKEGLGKKWKINKNCCLRTAELRCVSCTTFNGRSAFLNLMNHK